MTATKTMNAVRAAAADLRARSARAVEAYWQAATKIASGADVDAQALAELLRVAQKTADDLQTDTELMIELREAEPQAAAFEKVRAELKKALSTAAARTKAAGVAPDVHTAALRSKEAEDAVAPARRAVREAEAARGEVDRLQAQLAKRGCPAISAALAAAADEARRSANINSAEVELTALARDIKDVEKQLAAQPDAAAEVHRELAKRLARRDALQARIAALRAGKVAPPLPTDWKAAALLRHSRGYDDKDSVDNLAKRDTQ